MIKKYLKSYIYTFSIMLSGLIIITLLNYFSILNSSISDIFKLIIIVSSIFMGSFMVGKCSIKKGYLEGLKYGFIILLFIFLLNLILIRDFSYSLVIYYVIIVVVSILGSMFGINLKK